MQAIDLGPGGRFDAGYLLDVHELLARAHAELAEAQRWAGKFDQAIATLRQACDYATQYPSIVRLDQCLGYYLSIAELHVKIGRPEEARRFSRQAQALLVQHPEPAQHPAAADVGRKAHVIAAALDRREYGKAHSELSSFMYQFQQLQDAFGAAGVSPEEQWERLRTRLEALQCDLGELPAR